MKNPFQKKKPKKELTDKENENLKLHVAGATVRHKNFEHLTYYKNKEELTREFLNKWVSPFYMTPLTSDAYAANFESIAHELTEEIVEKLLGDFNWRTRITGATFSAIMNYKRFEKQIGTLLLKSEVTYAADGYVLALATFNSQESVEYFNHYLAYYLKQKKLWFDQNDVMAALKWLDYQNETNHHEEFLGLWDNFIADKENWDLSRSYSKFKLEMEAVEKLSKIYRVE